MSKGKRIAIVGLVLAVVAAAFIMKEVRRDSGGSEPAGTAGNATGAVSNQGDEAAKRSAEALNPATLPLLVDLGRGKCIPCKMMAPILEELKHQYAERFVVDVIDVGENREAATKYGIRVIPTQIFFDASGKERFRHEGFMSKEDILAKWEELGIDVKLKNS